MGNASAAVLPKPLPGLPDLLFFLFGLRLVVDRRVTQRAGGRIDDCFEQSYECRKLRLGQAVNQLVSVLAILSHIAILVWNLFAAVVRFLQYCREYSLPVTMTTNRYALSNPNQPPR